MLFDLDDVVSATEAGRSAPRYFRDASAGRRFIVFKDNQPHAAIIGMDDYRRLAELDAAAADTRVGAEVSPGPVVSAARRFLDDFGISDLRTWTPDRLWYDTLGDAGLFATLGLRTDMDTGAPVNGELVRVGLSGVSESGTGPHGFTQGVPGTGVHGLNVILALSLCARYAPQRVNLVLVDFSEMSEAGFDGLEALPHTIKYLANGITADVGGELDALVSAQIDERKRILSDADASTKGVSVKRYSDLHTLGSPWRLPEVFFIVSGGRQYFYENRQYLKILNRLATVGADLGMHLQLTDTYIDSTLYFDLLEHMSYGISFRANNAAASRAVVKTDSPIYFEAKDGPGQALIYETLPTQPDRADFPNQTRFVAFDPDHPAPGMDAMSVKDALIERIVAYDTVNPRGHL